MLAAIPKIWRGVEELGRSRVFYLGTLTGAHIVVHWYTQLLSLVLPSLKADLHLTDIQVGGITSAQMGVSNATTLPLGYVADSYRRQGALILTSAILAFGLATLALGMAPSYVWVLIGAALIGLATSLWHPEALGSLSLRFPDRRGLALSIHGIGASVGDSLGPIVVGAIIVAIGAWRPALMGHSVAALVIAFLLWRSLGHSFQTDGPRPAFRSYLTGIRGMLTNRQVLAVMTSTALTSMARVSTLTFLPIYIRETLGYSTFVLGIYLALLYVMGIVSQPVMGVISDRMGRKAVILPSFAAMGLLYIALIFAQGGVPLGLAVGALGLFFYAVLNITQTAIMDVAGERVQASTMGVMLLFSQPFTLASPILAGYLVGAFGIQFAFWYAAAATLLGAAILVPVRFRSGPGGGTHP